VHGQQPLFIDNPNVSRAHGVTVTHIHGSGSDGIIQLSTASSRSRTILKESRWQGSAAGRGTRSRGIGGVGFLAAADAPPPLRRSVCARSSGAAGGRVGTAADRHPVEERCDEVVHQADQRRLRPRMGSAVRWAQPALRVRAGGARLRVAHPAPPQRH
jgi:hypothetical protein